LPTPALGQLSSWTSMRGIRAGGMPARWPTTVFSNAAWPRHNPQSLTK